MSRNSRVQQIARLLYRQDAHRGKTCDVPMVKRVRKRTLDPYITIEDASFKVASRPKANQAWRYPGGVIQRADTLYLNGSTKAYYDPKEPDKLHPRRKQESNFFITINTNRRPTNSNLKQGQAAMEALLKHLADDTVVCSYMKFGPKDPDVYGDDNYNDVIQKIDFKSCVEVGENLNRLHAHIWMTVHHYSQVQINCPMIEKHALLVYNGNLPLGSDLAMRGKPYVNVKLLPQSNWTDIMKQYLHKGMEAMANA